MKTSIEGGWVVAYNGAGHEVYENGTVVYEGDRIIHAGGAYGEPVDETIDARGKLVSPGMINTHVHPAGSGGDYLLMDMSKNDYRTTNYLAYAAPLKGKAPVPPEAAVAAIRKWVFLHALKQGSTTIVDVGGLRGTWDQYARLIEELGLRVYFSPSFRDRNTFTDEQGRIYYEEDTEGGRNGLKEAVDFIRTYDGSAGGRLRGIMSPGHAESCSEPLLRAAMESAVELDVPLHTHCGGNLLEFRRVMDEYRKTPVEFLASIGLLEPRTLLGHGVFTTAHPWSHYPFGDDLARLAESGVTVGHCPYKYVKMAMTLRSFQRYVDAGINMAIGTDSYPMDIISELRWAAMLSKVCDENYQSGQPRDVFDAATLAPGKFMGRDDLGRLAPGAQADILLIDLEHMWSAFFRDPIKALVDYGSGRDVNTVIVAGKTLIRDGRSLHFDEEEVYRDAAQATHFYWKNLPSWHWGGYDADRLVPPAYPIHRAQAG